MTTPQQPELRRSGPARHASPRPHWFSRAVAVAGGLVFVVAGVWALAVPRSFFDVVATFTPYNQHFVQDLGAFQIGLGAVLLLSLGPRPDALAVALTGVGIGSAAHLLSHVVGADLGGRPAIDIPLLVLLTAALLVGGAVRRRSL